jgi:hypothetical protein
MEGITPPSYNLHHGFVTLPGRMPISELCGLADVDVFSSEHRMLAFDGNFEVLIPKKLHSTFEFPHPGSDRPECAGPVPAGRIHSPGIAFCGVGVIVVYTFSKYNKDWIYAASVVPGGDEQMVDFVGK